MYSIAGGMVSAGAADTNIGNAFNTLSDPDGSVLGVVLRVNEVTDRSSPLYGVQLFSELIYGTENISAFWPAVFTAKDRTLLSASGDNTAFADVEGLYANVSCSAPDAHR
jgi:hypothetical protein